MTAFWDEVAGKVVPCSSIDIAVAVSTDKVQGTTTSWFCKALASKHLSAFENEKDDPFIVPCLSITEHLRSSFPPFSVIQGLITPILRHADQKSLSAISSEVSQFASIGQFAVFVKVLELLWRLCRRWPRMVCLLCR